MKINQSDLKFYPSERLTDNDDGGGLAMGAPIKPDEIFDPISSLARVNGGIAMRKLFAKVARNDDEALIGSFVAITKPPVDASVSYLLFAADKFGEMRKAAINRIESYNSLSVRSNYVLLGNAIKGSNMILVYSHDKVMPQKGAVFALVSDDNYEYVQVEDMVGVLRSFMYGDNVRSVLVIKLTLTKVLSHEFIGLEYPDWGSAVRLTTKIYETSVTDSARFFGIKPARVTGNKVHVPSIFDNLIPTTTKETIFSDARALPNLTRFLPLHDISLAINASTNKLYLAPIHKGTLMIDKMSDKDGQIIQNGQNVGTVDYKTGQVVFDHAQYISRVNYTAAMVDEASVHSMGIGINTLNQSKSFALELIPKPISVQIHYRAQGNWYSLSADDGVFVGRGTGSINNSAVQFTTDELPDIDSTLIIQWTVDVGLNKEAIDVNNAKHARFDWARVSHGFFGENQVFLEVGGVRRALTYDGNFNLDNVELDGDVLKVYTDEAVGAQIAIHAVSRDYKTVVYNNGYDLGQALLPNTLSAIFANNGGSARDDGNGNMVQNGQNVGTVDYAKGRITFDVNMTITVDEPVYTPTKVQTFYYVYETKMVHTGYKKVNKSVPMTLPVSFYYHSDDNSQTRTTTISANVVKTFEFVHDNKMLYLLADNVGYVSQNNLIVHIDPLTGSARTVGHILDKTAIITENIGTLQSALVISQQGVSLVDKAIFHVPTAPIRPTVTIGITDYEGNDYTAMADNYGVFKSEYINGYVDVVTGAVGVVFGKYDTPTSDELVNSPDLIQNGKIFRPLPIRPDTVCYHAVGLTKIPVNNTLIKIDTVRLPADGRVPIFRVGDTVLIHHSAIDDLGSAFVGGQTISLSRQNVDKICVMDANDKAVDANLWTYDLTNGTITLNNALDLSGYAMPLKAKHTIEERNLITSVDIDGTLGLQFAVRHDYPEGAYISSVLVGGNLKARVSVPFTQRNWNNVWQDTPVGDELLNRLNVVDYPFVLTDEGAISERFVIRFTSGNQFELYGEALGFVGKFDTLTDLAPINPATKSPYFVLPKQAFGGAIQGGAPWAAQDVIRFNTVGAILPFWVIQSVQPTSTPMNEKDGFVMCLFGDTTV